MKKILIVVAFVAVVVLGAAGLAYAQADTPPDPPYPAPGYGYFGGGMMDGTQGRGRGMMGQRSGFRFQDSVGEYGPMHNTMIEAFAEALNLNPEEIESRLAEGETMWQIAESQGLTNEEFAKLMYEARAAALQAAVEAGDITQEQATWMLDRMQQMQGSGFGPGSGYCSDFDGDSSGFNRSPRGRWNVR